MDHNVAMQDQVAILEMINFAMSCQYYIFPRYMM